LAVDPDDVREHNGRKHPVENCLLVMDLLNEPSDLLDDRIRAGPERHPFRRRKLDALRAGDHGRRIAALPD
jgi:hypothetical protein